MDDTGIDYLTAPDGSQGGDGRVWATPEETTVKRDDGTYDIPVKPGTVINLNPGDEWTPPGSGPILVDEIQSVTAPLPTRGTGIPGGGRGPFPSTGAGDYPVVLEIDDINITNPGFGYNPDKDKIIIETSDGTSKGAELKIKTDPLGSITGVDVVKGGIGFNEDPKIYIQSDSGYNAKMIPVFKVNRIGEDASPEVVAAAGTPGVIQVIDCVGKV